MYSCMVILMMFDTEKSALPLLHYKLMFWYNIIEEEVSAFYDILVDTTNTVSVNSPCFTLNLHFSSTLCLEAKRQLSQKPMFPCM